MLNRYYLAFFATGTAEVYPAALAWLVASALNSTFEFGGNPTKNGEVPLEK